MRYLLDTHVLLWWLSADPALDGECRALIEKPESDVYVSAASILEISIKQAQGRLDSPTDILAQLRINRIQILPITAEHAYAIRSLPMLHKDPFDRLLIVQALLEDLTILTRDALVLAYSVPCIKA